MTVEEDRYLSDLLDEYELLRKYHQSIVLKGGKILAQMKDVLAELKRLNDGT